MNQFKSIVQKELLLLLRDRAGLGILFLMPVVFILIMSIVQDSAFKSLKDVGLPVVLVNNDQDSLGAYLSRGLHMTEFCQLHKPPKTQKTQSQRDWAYEAVANGKYMIGIVIPKGATQNIRTHTQTLIQSALSDSVQRGIAEKSQIEIFYDPTTKGTMTSAISSKLNEFISALRSRIIFETFAKEVRPFLPENNAPLAFDNEMSVELVEQYAANKTSKIIPNSVQHNVPAWTIFGMFFIVVPLAGSIIKEKQEGSSIRLKTLPGPFVLNHLGKLTVYTFVCMIQFVLMMFFGWWVLPMLGLPVLQFGAHLPAIAITGGVMAFACASFGMLVGTISNSYQQAAIGGSLSILILASVGGIWVPMHIMPDYMQVVSKVSPLNWGMEAFYLIFLRGQGLLEVLPYLISFAAFFILNISITTFVIRWKNRT